MRYSGVGGQAVMEGIMMKNQDKYAVAVRKPDRNIEIKVEDYKGVVQKKAIRNLPLVRGVISFIESLYLGMETLTYSASFFEDEEEKKEDKPVTEEEKEKQLKKEKRQEKVLLGGTVAFSVVLALAIFFVLPYGLSRLLGKVVENPWIIAIFEGVIRLCIFIGYIGCISFMPDIRRVFMYHGAEHKCINCIEHGLELNVENVRKSSRLHKRCGTNFIIIVMLISIVVFLFIRVETGWLRLVLRLLLIPVIAGISYEFIRLAGKYENWFTNIFSKPGMWMQKLTTREPEDDMIEVGIASVEAVFDWKKWQEEEK